jgi:hypothetical protein
MVIRKYCGFFVSINKQKLFANEKSFDCQGNKLSIKVNPFKFPNSRKMLPRNLDYLAKLYITFRKNSP